MITDPHMQQVAVFLLFFLIAGLACLILDNTKKLGVMWANLCLVLELVY